MENLGFHDSTLRAAQVGRSRSPSGRDEHGVRTAQEAASGRRIKMHKSQPELTSAQTLRSSAGASQFPYLILAPPASGHPEIDPGRQHEGRSSLLISARRSEVLL